ncbi:glutamate ABC transporter substrate-binding protein [Streptomyces sp. DSM 44915]|uniref:Glutamate ABC transporter substrate-binding protein n=1 Tax=Streptomyces chisholmiae TaxID=3075540 RepID=A0ABU2JMF2_9ACTN|nr:glutamate ABC transporter substrate-binding protein [Streptomyces sp. DSM 44915]MDT0266162.1 glutamate ABC transporter substrate-binding protein [Streptomyces sp. DSM 44915]
MRLRKASAIAASVLALSLAATACGGGDDEGGSGDGGGDTINVGIKYDQPGLGLKTPDGEFVGFDVDVATYIAGELGYEPDQINFVESPSGDRETMLDRGDVDFIVASYSITDERKEMVDFAGPYFVAHQDLLIRDGESVSNPEEIADLMLCSVGGSTSAANLSEQYPGAGLHELATYSECLTGLENGTVDALTTDDSILAGYAAQEQNVGKFALAGLNLSDEYYGVGVPKGETELRDDINAAITAMVDEGAWQESIDEHFGPANYAAEPAPEITETS